MLSPRRGPANTARQTRCSALLPSPPSLPGSAGRGGSIYVCRIGGAEACELPVLFPFIGKIT